MRQRLVPTLELEQLARLQLRARGRHREPRDEARDPERRSSASCAADCLIGFATSGLPRAQIAAGARHPERCFVNHPFYPAWRALPIEVVLSGDDALGRRMVSVLRELGKVPDRHRRRRLLRRRRHLRATTAPRPRASFAEGLATPAQIDQVVDEAVGGGGPFLVMDLTRGNPLNVHCLELMRAAPTGSAWFDPPAIFRAQGVKPWHEPGKPTRAPCAPEVARQIRDRILAVLLARTYFVADNGICAPSDLDWLTRNALGFSTGLLDLAERLGAGEAHRVCTAYAAAHPGFEVPRSIRDRRLARFARNVVVERDGDLAVVVVRRPEVRNALSALTLRELDEAIAALGADAGVRGIVLTSFDGAIAGADIGELAALPDAGGVRGLLRRRPGGPRPHRGVAEAGRGGARRAGARRRRGALDGVPRARRRARSSCSGSRR